MTSTRFTTTLAGCLLVMATAATADCSKWPQFAKSQDYLQPLSVQASDIGTHLTASKWSENVAFTSEVKGGDLWLDVTSFPGTTTAAAAPRALMQVGRLADDGFDRLVLAHDGTGLFAISREQIRSIGCRFVWGVEGGENPIALMRELYRHMTYFDGRALTTAWNGSLLGDTGTAMRLNNEVVLPAWIMADIN